MSTFKHGLLRRGRIRFGLIFFAVMALSSCQDTGQKNTTAPKTNNATSTQAAPIEIPKYAGEFVWTVDKTASRIAFNAEQGGTGFTGVFSRFDIAILLDPDNPQQTGKITAIIDLSSVGTGDGERDVALPQADWFDTAQYPQALFQSKKIGRSDTGYVAAGILSMKGISRDLALPFTLTRKDGRATAKAKLTLNRQDFNVGSGPYNGDDWIAYPVEVDLYIEATR